MREALRDCPDGGLILFDPDLDGATLNLNNQLQFNNKAVQVDATRLPRRVTLDRGGGSSRVVNIQSGGSLSMHAVSCTGGNASLAGGGIRSAGRLVLTPGNQVIVFDPFDDDGTSFIRFRPVER